MNKREDVLLPCPFCGCGQDNAGEYPYPANRDRSVWIASCGNLEGCGAMMEHPTREGVIEAWNRRDQIEILYLVSEGGDTYSLRALDDEIRHTTEMENQDYHYRDVLTQFADRYFGGDGFASLGVYGPSYDRKKEHHLGYIRVILNRS